MIYDPLEVSIFQKVLIIKTAITGTHSSSFRNLLMSKVKLLRNVPTKKILRMLPPTLSVLVDIDSIIQDKVNLAIFSVDNRQVATSGEVKKIADNISELIPLVIVGGSFTVEAAEMARSVAQYFYCRQEDFWTDKTYHYARQGKH